MSSEGKGAEGKGKGEGAGGESPRISERQLMVLGKGNYFGERALLTSEPRAANCVADGEVVDAFELVK